LADAPAGRRFRGGYTDCLAQLGLGPGPPGPVRTGLLIAGARSPTISSCPESRWSSRWRSRRWRHWAASRISWSS